MNLINDAAHWLANEEEQANDGAPPASRPRAPGRRLSPDQIEAIRMDRGRYENIAKRHDVTHWAVRQIKKGDSNGKG